MKVYAVLLSALLLCGCGASYFSASTKGSFTFTDGTATTTANYESTKDQQGFTLEIDPDTKKLLVHVDKSNTSEAAIAAAAAAMATMAKTLDRVSALLEKAAIMGATKGMAQ